MMIMKMKHVKERYATMWMVIYIVVAVVIALVFTSCKTKVVTIEKIHDVYHNTTDTIRDSIMHKVYVNQYVKGDTVYKDRIEYRYRDRWRIRDSVLVVTDSVPIPYPVENIVEKPVTPWYNWLLIGALSLTVLYQLFKRILGG